jgi:DNA-binding NarL/FixJ family response regulator
MRVAVLAADPLTAESLGCLLESVGGFRLVGCLAGLGSSLPVINQLKPEVLVVSEWSREAPLAEALVHLSANGIKILLVSHSTDEVGAGEFVRVSSWAGIVSLCGAVRQVAGIAPSEAPAKRQAASDLTPREAEAAKLIARGLSNRSIAHTLGISEPTAKLYVSKLLRIYGCSSRVQLALKLNAEQSADQRR